MMDKPFMKRPSARRGVPIVGNTNAASQPQVFQVSVAELSAALARLSSLHVSDLDGLSPEGVASFIEARASLKQAIDALKKVR